jgi:hypothetical protein
MFLCGYLIQTQAQTNLKQKYYFVKSDTLYLDSLSLIPGTISITAKNLALDTSTYKINYPIKAIIFKVKPRDPVLVCYKSFPYNFEKSFYHQSTSLLTKDLSLPSNPLTLAFLNSDHEIVDFKDMEAEQTKSVSPDSNFVKYVVEANKDTFKELGIKVGDKLEYKDNKIVFRKSN